ncbi:MAG: polysaccharide deacetylase family protein [Lachnoclostridium sp.]|nr:polysaccharide deacetylase family protein [Lachnospira sp.]MCM1247290.1 polysaccharide deacetylase family protein [Lachnoclostridium sp.]MCM1534408.1 polysaccharide deacetylase family protein [Clostridium sp.]
MKKLYIVMYHYVRDLQNSRYPRIKGLDYGLFEKQLEYFAGNFKVVTMEEVIAHYMEDYQLPERAMLLTFDDGYIDGYTTIMPILHKYKMQGSFFVPGKVFNEHCLLDVNKIHFLLATTSIDILCRELCEQMDFYRGKPWDYPSNKELFEKYAVASRFDTKETIFFKRVMQFVLPEELRALISSSLFQKHMDVSEEILARELYLNYDQMRLMKNQGGYFGVHGYDHYWMNQLPPEALKEDIQKALDCMGDLIDRNQWVINYPYGSYSEEVITNLKGSGCVLGLSTDVRVADLEKDNPFTLPRLDTNDFPPVSEHYKSVGG